MPPILNRMETCEDPPTYNHTNKFTNAFQVLIDSYGIASYREMNPAPYTIITFPFLFAVMFGDTGHGLLMALFGGWMILKEKPLTAKKSDSEVSIISQYTLVTKTEHTIMKMHFQIWNMLFGGRYIVFLMGLFSMYTGFIYNDVFSKSLNVFGSNWQVNMTRKQILGEKLVTLNPSTNDYLKYPYPIGLDPVWQLADNKIVFQNAYKMKISIIFGVCHMLFGIVMSYLNHR